MCSERTHVLLPAYDLKDQLRLTIHMMRKNIESYCPHIVIFAAYLILDALLCFTV